MRDLIFDTIMDLMVLIAICSLVFFIVYCCAEAAHVR